MEKSMQNESKQKEPSEPIIGWKNYEEITIIRSQSRHHEVSPLTKFNINIKQSGGIKTMQIEGENRSIMGINFTNKTVSKLK